MVSMSAGLTLKAAAFTLKKKKIQGRNSHTF